LVSLSLGKRRSIPLSRSEKTEEDKKMIREWLAKKGNKITICPPDTTTPEEDVVYIYKVGKRGKK